MLWQQMLARSCFLLLLWLSGLLAHALDGLTAAYMLELNVYLSIFGTFFIILFGSYYIQRTLSNLVRNFRPMIELDDLQFKKLSERLEQYSYSFLPCLFITLGFAVFAGAPSQFQQALTEGFKLHLVWSLSISVFGWLLAGTAIWMFVSIWLTIFLISRQPLNVKLSPETISRFRELNMLAFWFSLFYFIGVSIGNVPFLASAPALSLVEIVVSPYLFFIGIGIIGILLPFYNIHRALVGLKRQELLKISEESEQLVHQLDEVLAKQPTKQVSDQTLTIMARLFSMQVKEKRIEAAQEWPIDISFLSKLAVVGLIPIVSRIVAMLIVS